METDMEDKRVCEETEETSQPQDIHPAAESPLVSVTFQTDPHRRLKYLESEPKALGVTQITFSVLKIVAYASFYVLGFNLLLPQTIMFLIESVLVMIAGSLALVAQNLHLPTLKACLGMQVVASVISTLNLFAEGINFESGGSNMCWMYLHDNDTGVQRDSCSILNDVLAHLTAEGILVQAALVAISVTLAAYCCKVINCCSPSSRMPVITVQAPPTQQ